MVEISPQALNTSVRLSPCPTSNFALTNPESEYSQQSYCILTVQSTKLHMDRLLARKLCSRRNIYLEVLRVNVDRNRDLAPPYDTY